MPAESTGLSSPSPASETDSTANMGEHKIQPMLLQIVGNAPIALVAAEMSVGEDLPGHFLLSPSVGL